MTFWIFAFGVAAGAIFSLFVANKKSKNKMRICASAANLRGKLALITGANSGLGREIAFQLAKRQADVVLACRDASKAKNAIDFIQNRLAQTAGDFGKLFSMDLDLSDLRSVDSFADEFQRRFDQLHILINNAGLMACPYSTSRGGTVELQFAVNHLGHFHLTNRLLPILRRSSPSRILIVTSGYYRKMQGENLGNIFSDAQKLSKNDTPPSNYDPLKAYARSKLANCLHGVKLAKRTKEEKPDQPVDVYVIRPGFVRGTELGRHFNGLLTTVARPLIWFFSQNVEQGVQTYLHCALSERDELRSGALYYDCAEQPYLENLVDEALAENLWSLSEKFVEQELKALGEDKGEKN